MADEPSISLEINGRTWHQVRTLAESGPKDRHFTVEMEADGKATLRFGDGAQGARPPSGTTHIGVPYRAGSGSLHVVLQQGHTRRNDDQAELEIDFHGIYRGVITGNLDPLNQMRLMVQVPAVMGLEERWALPCLPAGAFVVPQPGKHVWVMFEHGDPAYPVWMGIMRD